MSRRSGSVFSFRAVAAGLASRSALLACACCALAGWGVLDDYGIGPDEANQQKIARATVDYVADMPDALRQDPDRYYGSVLELKYYGPVFELALWAAERVLGLQDSRAVALLRHYLTHLLFVGAGWCCARIAFHLYGSRALALCALGLFVLHPRLYAHSFVNSKDLPFLSLFMLALYLLHRACRRDTAAAFALCGVGVGLLTSVRVLGAMLFVAALALRACDAIGAADGPARRRVLRTGGLFAAVSALTTYVTFPYLWPDPVGRFIEVFTLMNRHPVENDDLFRGALVPYTEVLPDYIPVWLAITTPPLALLLASGGAAALLRRVAIQPGAALRNTPERFGLLLLACFVLPLLLVVLLRSNLYNGWRQMYFLYAPLCLLATAGLQAAAGALPARRSRLYGAAGLGLGATAFAMAGLHPHQSDYFNFLVNRAAPERLAAQYELDYWGLTSRAALDYLRVRHAGSVYINKKPGGEFERNQRLLPAADRARIALDSTRADFHIQVRPGPYRLDVYAPVYARRAYNNVLYNVITLNLERADADTTQRYRAAYRAATAAPPAVRARFDAYLDARAVTFVQAPCRVEDTLPKFILHVFPVDPRRLPASARAHGFDNWDFDFFRRGVRFKDACMAQVPLPAYAIQRLRVGQWIAAENRTLWQTDIAVPRSPEAYRAAYAALAPAAPAVRAAFDVYVTPEAAFFAKSPCRAADTEAKFILHVVPRRRRHLPPARRPYGFDNQDFQFDWQGAHFDGHCLARAALPAYPIRQLRVGQFQSGDSPRMLWQAEIPGPR